MTLYEEMDIDIQLGESQTLEFIVSFPGNTHELAKEIAAFATSNPGTIYIGIADDGEKIGICNNKEQFNEVKDVFQNRIAGIVKKGIQPPIEVRVDFVEGEGKLFSRITVPKGREPAYYSNNIAYYRNITTSDQATWDIIKELHRKYFLDGETQHRRETKSVIFFETLMQLSDFELLWTDYQNRMINPDMEQLRYDIDVSSDILMKLSFEDSIQMENFEGEMQDISNLMKGLSHHRFFMDGGKSYKEFQEKGEIILDKINKLKPRIMKRVSLTDEEVKNNNDILIKLIRELKNNWKQKEDFLKRGEIDVLKENMRRIAYRFYRISNIPTVMEGQKYSSDLREIAICLRELSSVKYFMKGLGINPIKNIEEKMNDLIKGLDGIETSLK